MIYYPIFIENESNIIIAKPNDKYKKIILKNCKNIIFQFERDDYEIDSINSTYMFKNDIKKISQNIINDIINKAVKHIEDKQKYKNLYNKNIEELKKKYYIIKNKKELEECRNNIRKRKYDEISQSYINEDENNNQDNNIATNFISYIDDLIYDFMKKLF